MNPRTQRAPATHANTALVHRGPQAISGTIGVPLHAPNAALLIDFDNVTMGIRSDLGKELRTLLGSDIIRGKVAVQRAYADWRRYPQYIVPLSEASIDLIFAPAYGSSKKNATDIRLAIDALELVFTRPEIGTFILLSGDSDFSSLVIKLKEYGKYVIGVGIRESSSDLLVQNCDEYYSYNALAGLVKASEDDETARKWDPWELVTEAVQRMKRNGDVMRSDRLKQVMQDIDASFDEKNLGMSKFSRFTQEAAARGLVTITKLENGQIEIGLPPGTPVREAPVREGAAAEAPARGRRGRRGRGRGREREEREREQPEREQQEPEQGVAVSAPVAAPDVTEVEPAVPAARAEPTPGATGERLTRNEAFDLVRRAVQMLADEDRGRPARATDVRRKARELLGRDSESLSERMFVRVLKDAHDAGAIDLRRRGDDFEVSPAVAAEPIADQLARAEGAAVSSAPPSTPSVRLGMGPRGARARVARGAEPPPDLLSVGVIEPASAPAPASPSTPAAATPAQPETTPARRPSRRRPAKKTTRTAAKAAATTQAPAVGANGGAPKPRQTRAKKTGTQRARTPRKGAAPGPQQ